MYFILKQYFSYISYMLLYLGNIIRTVSSNTKNTSTECRFYVYERWATQLCLWLFARGKLELNFSLLVLIIWRFLEKLY